MEVLKRLISALAIFAPLGVYLFGVQVIYDKVEVAKEPGLKAVLFLVALVAGSATYDFAKRALFMPRKHFLRFFGGLFGAWLAMIFLLLFAAASALILEYPGLKGQVPPWVGHLSYVFSLACIPWFIIDLSRAIEAATK
jgi:uncharacterized membrane protein required for colicin V production